MATPEGLTEPVSFRETAAFYKKLECLAKLRATNPSAIYREAARYYFNSDRLTDQEKKLLEK